MLQHQGNLESDVKRSRHTIGVRHLPFAVSITVFTLWNAGMLEGTLASP